MARKKSSATVREAKNRLSELIRRASTGEEITITYHGEPRARLCRAAPPPRLFRIDWTWLREMKSADRQTPAEELVRSERDGRD